jgi:hypothetical protein
MKLFLLVFISAALGLTISILLYKYLLVNVSPLITGLSINAIGYYFLKNKLD